MHWLVDRIRGVVNSWVERAIGFGLLVSIYFLWRHRGAAVSLDVEVPVWVLLLGAAVSALGLLLLMRRVRALPASDETEHLANLVELGEYYAIHLYDTLESLQKVLRGTIPNVTPASFIENGVLQPAREFLMQRPGEDVRLSVLIPSGTEWRMVFAAGYRLESKQRFRMSIDASFSRHALQSGEIQWSLDLPNDPRFIPHPQASRTYYSLISTPVRSGDEVVGVLNVDSTEEAAFSQPDFIYVRLLGAIVSVVWSLVDLLEDEEAR